MSAPDSRALDAWESGARYERYIGRWSRRVAPAFVSWLNPTAGRTWLDLGCGTGALSEAILDGAAPHRLVGIEPSEELLELARQSLGARARFHQANAMSIPHRDSSTDVVVSGLVLNFLPDTKAAVAEMTRVATTGGLVAAYVWDYAGRMDLVRRFWDAAVELEPGARTKDEGLRFPVCTPDALRALFAEAGLESIETNAIELPTHFSSFDDYWEPFLGGVGPAPAYAMSLEESARGRLRDRIQERMPIEPDGSIALRARAWAVRGTVVR